MSGRGLLSMSGWGLLAMKYSVHVQYMHITCILQCATIALSLSLATHRSGGAVSEARESP